MGIHEHSPCYLLQEVLRKDFISLGIGMELVRKQVNMLRAEEIESIDIIDVPVTVGLYRLNAFGDLFSYGCQSEADGVGGGFPRWRQNR